MEGRFAALTARVARRPWLTLGLAAVLAVACAALATGLRPSSDVSTLVSRGSADYRATQADNRSFGGNAVVILVREPLTDLVETRDLGVLTELEACLAGQVVVPDQQLQAFKPAPAGSLPAYGGPHSPCGALMRSRPAQVVYGPGTFLNRAVAAVNQEIASLESGAGQAVKRVESAAYQVALSRHMSKRQAQAAAQAAGQLEQQQQLQQLESLAVQSGITGAPSIQDPNFIPEIVFDQTRGVNQPKARFSYLFPTKNAALIQVRLKSSLSDSRAARAIQLIRRAVAMKMFRLGYGGRYTVTGEPVVLNDLASAISGSILVLLIGAVVVMALVLMLVFGGALRLLPLAIALGAAAITFGLMELAGAGLTMASIAVLPVLIGLSVDYAIQFQSRAREATGRGTGARGEAGGAAAVEHAAHAGAPTIAAAALATATGFLVLLLSPVPMVRGFGVLLVIGIAVAFATTITAGAAALTLAGRRAAGGRRGVFRTPHVRKTPRQALWTGTVASARGAAEILADATAPLKRLANRVPRPNPANLARHPGRVLAAGLVLAVLGWAADTQTGVQSDVTKLVPSNMAALQHLRTLERVTGVSGEIDVVVRGRNVATPQTVGWMIGYENQLLDHFGYLESKGCFAATLCPALSLPDLFQSQTNPSQSSTSGLTAAAIQGLLSAVPTYFSQAVITPDHRAATLAFGLRLMPFSRQQRVIDYMRAHLHPPRGINAALAGLPVLAADANGALSSSARRLLTLLAGLLAVGLVLLAIFRRPRRALTPLVPIVLATGWSALVVFAIGIPLNPMSATLGSLVIAISTEFSVLLSERYRQERARGGSADECLTRTYRSTGAAVLASGVTAIAGFGVLILSDITMLRDFGFVTVIDLAVSLAGVMLVLPAVLALAERRRLLETDSWRGLGGTRALAARRRRRARVAA
jgi:hydrophobe/amphiphile efflux-3 (HAE3) family protein